MLMVFYDYGRPVNIPCGQKIFLMPAACVRMHRSVAMCCVIHLGRVATCIITVSVVVALCKYCNHSCNQTAH